MKKDYDALVELDLLPTEAGGRAGPVFSGYRGAHLIKDDCLTTGELDLIEVEMLRPGNMATAYVSYLSPEHYPHTLWIGKEMNVQEGSHVVGKAKILEIYNDLLKREET